LRFAIALIDAMVLAACAGEAVHPQPATALSSALRSSLEAIACPAPSRCEAVGYLTPDGAARRPLAESWNGRSWSVDPVGGAGELTSVACVSRTSCVAVGDDGPTADAAKQHALAATWDGASWSVERAAAAGDGSALRAVACISFAVCMAVGWRHTVDGDRTSTLVESDVGGSWSVVSSPAPESDSWLNSIACTSTSTCFAAGSASEVSTSDEDPNPGTGGTGALLSVSCTSASFCMLVGAFTRTGDPYRSPTATTAQVWDGRAWTVVATPSPTQHDQLNAVRCFSPHSCIAVGDSSDVYARPLVEIWDGAGWTLRPSGSPRDHPRKLIALACTDASSCLAVGSLGEPGSPDRSQPLVQSL
jgi:hypothetical protein